MIMLLIAAIGALLGGVLAILYGIPVKEFSFGNTMVLAGAIGVCTSLVLFGLWIVTREMRAVARRIAMPGSAGLHDPNLHDPNLHDRSLHDPSRPELGAPAARPAFPTRPPARGAISPPPAIEPAPVVQPDPQDVIEARAAADLSPPAQEPTPEPKSRRNLLFESSVRKDRERVAAAPERPQRMVFDDPIAQRGADRADRLQRTRSPSTFAEPKPDLQSGVTVLKSGVVDGMSYSLYSDGSIEAEMPEGLMRFSSIDELRTHLDQRP